MDNKLLIAKIEDKINTCKTKNKITLTDFFNEYQIAFLEKELKKLKQEKYFFYGGYDNSTRKILIFYPEKILKEDVLKNINSILNVIKIELPNEIKGLLKHKNYLGTIMSFGLVRERIGDIICFEDRAYIIVLKENAEYLKNEFMQERRFKKAKIEIVDLEDIEEKELEFEEIKINVNSLRLDNIISEIIKTSRKIAQEYLEEEKVFLNYELETKSTKQVKEKDLLVVRGKGKYIINSFLGETRSGKTMICVKKYI